MQKWGLGPFKYVGVQDRAFKLCPAGRYLLGGGLVRGMPGFITWHTSNMKNYAPVYTFMGDCGVHLIALTNLNKDLFYIFIFSFVLPDKNIMKVFIHPEWFKRADTKNRCIMRQTALLISLSAPSRFSAEKKKKKKLAIATLERKALSRCFFLRHY